MSTLVFVLIAHRDLIRTKIGQDSIQQTQRPYFHALISSKQNTSWISRKLRELPGVEVVEVLPEDTLKQQVNQLLSGMDQEVMQVVGAIEFTGIKVVARPELEDRSIILIKDYLVRLAGPETTVGATVIPTKVLNQKKISFQHYSFEIVAAFAVLIWFVTIAINVKPLRRNAYLIEQFQRRRKVAGKTWMVASIFAIALGGAGAFSFKNPDLLALGICAVIAMTSAAIHMRRSSWEG